MPHPDKRAALGTLTVKRLGALCDAFEVDRAATARKNGLIDLLVRSRQASLKAMLALLKHEELKEICRVSGLDVAGKEKDTLVTRILGRDPASPPPPPQTDLPGLQPSTTSPKTVPAGSPAQKATTSLSTTIKTIQDIMRKDVGVDGDAQRIGQLVWLLFLKIWDDREQELELIEKAYSSPLVDVTWTDVSGKTRTTPDLRWRIWAANPEGDTGDKLLLFVNDTLFAALKGMQPGTASRDLAAEALRRRRALIKSVFEDAYQYMKSGTLLRQVINKVQEAIDFNDSRSRHLFGDIYEQILRDLQGAGNAGEYYTPRALTQFAVDMVDPRLDEIVFDPACGTGGFLACAIEHIRRNYVKTPAHEISLQTNIRGVEKKPLPHILCTTNMIVHEIDVPKEISHGNTLGRPLRDYSARDRVHVVITNPPFGGMEEDGVEDNFPNEFRTRETADLFLVLIIELLKEGGRAAVVLPDGTLFGEGIKTRIKEKLLSECDLHTIVRLPKGVFAPYTSIQTNILFFTKGRPTREIWYYEHPYPTGIKSYSKTKPLRIEEFDAEKTWWNDRKETKQAWKVSLADIKARGFNLDFKNPNAPSASHENPDTVLVRYEQAKAAAVDVGEQLRKALSERTRMNPQQVLSVFEFEIIANAPCGIKLLRELVLQLAVRGKLVPQNEAEEPSELFCNRARTAAQELLDLGKIGRRRSLPSIDEAETRFALPSAWRWQRIDDLFHVSGGIQKSGRQTVNPLTVPFLRVANVQRGHLDLTEVHTFDVSPEELDRLRLTTGDILIVEGNGSESEIGRCARWTGEIDPCIHQNHLIKVRPLVQGAEDFLSRYLNSPDGVAVMKSLAVTTSGLYNLSVEKIRSIVIPVPPFPEQHRIVARVDELLHLIDHLETRLSAARDLQAQFAAAAVHHLNV